MRNITAVNEWLQIAFLEQHTLNEYYYYDSPEDELFSIFFTDYLLTAADASMVAQCPYSDEELTILTGRMQRISDLDPTILGIPRLMVEERKEMMLGFLDMFRIHDEALHSYVDAENGRTKLNFNENLPAGVIEEWDHYKFSYVQGKIDSFCNTNVIDLDTVKLFKDEKMISVSLDLIDNPDPAETRDMELLRKAKPWWKFWI